MHFAKFFSILGIIALTITTHKVSAQEKGTHNVKTSEFAERSNKGGTLLDVRTKREFDEGHIDGAINIDYFDRDFKSKISGLDKNKPVFVYCHTGNRSSKAMLILKEEGFTSIYNLEGGYTAWKAEK